MIINYAPEIATTSKEVAVAHANVITCTISVVATKAAMKFSWIVAGTVYDDGAAVGDFTVSFEY